MMVTDTDNKLDTAMEDSKDVTKRVNQAKRMTPITIEWMKIMNNTESQNGVAVLQHLIKLLITIELLKPCGIRQMTISKFKADACRHQGITIHEFQEY